MLASMAINGLWNNRSGPGGGTRRLHHVIWGRHRIDTRGKDKSFVRHGTVVIGLNLISVAFNSTRREKAIAANANRIGFVTPVAMNNNREVAAQVAA